MQTDEEIVCDAWVPMIAQLFIFGRRLGTIHLLSFLIQEIEGIAWLRL